MPRPFYLRETPGTLCIGDWVVPGDGLDGCGKTPPPPLGFDPWTVQPVTSRYTDCALLGLDWTIILKSIVKKWDEGYELDCSGSGSEQVEGTCECGNEPSGYIKCGEFLD
jgi:hypothetical protein